MDINLEYTTSFDKHWECPDEKFYIVSEGGQRSGKTYSILQILILLAITNPYKKLTISVVAETVPSLKRGTIRDFQDIMFSAGIWDDRKWNKTDRVYNLMGNTIEFISVDTIGKARGAARDYLFINEANLISYEICFHLISRTRIRTFIDYNPTNEFWVHSEILDDKSQKNNVHFVHTTYLDNEFLQKTIIDIMLKRAAKDDNYNTVYVKGLVGKLEGVIYENYFFIDEIPQEVFLKANKQWIGVDWGWDDVTSGCSVYIKGTPLNPINEIWVDEFMYDQNLRIAQIANKVKENILKDNYEVVADSSEPRNIDEFNARKIKTVKADKPDGSVNFGIELLQNSTIYVTKSSVNLIKEFRNYKWDIDKITNKVKRDKKNRPIPIDNWNHLLDALRYVAMKANSEKFEYKSKHTRSRGLVIA